MIRDATVEDLDQIMALGTQFHQESRYAVFGYDNVKTRMFFQTIIENKDGMFLVYDTPNGIIGGMVGWAEKMYFGHDIVLSDFALFVSKDRRGQIAGASLIKAYIEYGKKIGAHEIILSNSSGIDRDRIAKLYERLGLTHVGYVYSYTNKE